MPKLPKLPVARMILVALIISAIGFGYKTLSENNLVLVPRERAEVVNYCKGDYTYTVCKEAMDKGIENQTSSVLDILRGDK